MSPVEIAVRKYLQRMAEIRSTGGATSESSFYSALENLLNELGKQLDPNVICNGQLRNQGAGHPDFGLYSKKQCSKGAPKPGQGEIPERGVVEVKPLAEESWQTVKGEQATKYFDRYRLVLVTNYREFRLIGEDDAGRSVEREFFSLAADELAFWSLAAHPIKAAVEQGVHFGEFLLRVMMNAASLWKPEDVAWFLASYARDGLVTLAEKDASSLAPLRTALEAALGIKFEGGKGEHFFRSTLVQTLFYGVFSAWVIHMKSGGTGRFDWRSASYILTVPMIRSLFEEIAKPSRLAPLGLMHVLDRTGEALNRVDGATFFECFDSGQAVQHFYEPFLEAFDPDLRKEMGVWYTPPEIVRYMVARVDTVLRNELHISDGLADKNVYVLDPCCGTGAFIVEVLRRIGETLRAKGEDPLIADDIKDAARDRIFGFEIMSAPFVIAHWQVGNLLVSLGAPIDSAKGERPSIYLTNALTGWQPPTGPRAKLPLFPELEREREQSERLKRDVPILVVIGNPPYNAYAGTSPDEEEGLVEPYKHGLSTDWGIKKFNLDELYVRFLRVAERRIAATGRGIICYISSYSYLSDPSFVVARKNLLNEFDRIWVDSLNGDSRETGKKTPSGDPDPSVFSTRYNRAGIRLGTAVGLFVRRKKRATSPTVAYRDFWGKTKRKDLVASLEVTPFDESYKIADPQPWNRLSLRPVHVRSDYLTWPKLIDLAGITPINGLMEKRSGALIDIDREALADRMRTYFDPSLDWEQFKLTGNPLANNAARYDARKARERAISLGAYNSKQLVRYIVRPFDVRHAYFTDIRPIWNEPRRQLWTQFSSGNRFLISRPSGVARPEGIPMFYTRCLGDNDAQRGHSYYFPFEVHDSEDGRLRSGSGSNLSAAARNYLSHLVLPDPKMDADARGVLWLHALAVGFSPGYLAENADCIAVDWPRIPLPDDRADFDTSVGLGERVAAILDIEAEVPGITTGTVADYLKVLGSISAIDLNVGAGWGSKDRGGRINPGRGKTETRNWTESETTALETGCAALGIAKGRGFELLGQAVDVYLNDKTYWRGVPEAVWEYLIGGYQVIKKWLSYREEVIIGRPLTKIEAREVTAMVRRLTALVLMTDELDANYMIARDNSYAWPSP